MKQSKLEAIALEKFTGCGVEVIQEWSFCPGREWRFDFAIPGRKIAFEIDGGTWSQGRHTRGGGYQDDCYKLNRAAETGWTVYRFTGAMVKGGALSRLLDRLKVEWERRDG